MSKNISAIVLAAGTATINDQNKLLLPVADKPMVRRPIETLAQCGVNEIVCVVEDAAGPVARVLDGLGVTIAIGVSEGRSPAASLKRGLEASSEAAEAYLILPGDFPLLTTEIVESLIATFNSSHEGIVVPAYQNVPGYPAILDRRFRDPLMALDENRDLRRILVENPQNVIDMHFLTDAVVFDVDDVDDYHVLLRRLGLPTPGESVPA
jgi:molybdenum cofactor cytidylyltransferase